MALKLTRPALDVGIVSTGAPRMLAFYRDVMGFAPDGQVPFPGIGVVHRLRCGESILKLLEVEKAPAARAPGGDFTAATGLRYVTLPVANLDELVSACRRFGSEIPVEPRTLRPGTRAAMVLDPDGNTIELIGP